MSTVQSAAQLPSALRPIPLRMRPDLRCERISYQGVGTFVVKDPVALKYFRFQAEQFRILQLLDGKRNLEEISELVRREFPALGLLTSDVQRAIAEFHRNGLTLSDRPGQGPVFIKQRIETRLKLIRDTLKSILFLRLPGWDPERSLRFLDPWFGWIFGPIGFAVWLVVVGSASAWLLVQFDTFRGKLPEFEQFFGWPNLLYMWMVLGVAKILHEFGHGLACKRYGGECHEMGVMLLVFSPCLYCDVTDSWMLHSKWKRIAIAAAGMYVEIFLSSIAIFGWWFSSPGLFNYLCLNLFFVSTVSTVIFNANPLMRYDGYYMLSDYLEVPNLRPKATKLLREAFGWYCLGIEPRHDPFMPTAGRGWFVAYAIACTVYQWIVLASILYFLYTFLKPYELQSIGIAMAAVSVAAILGSMIFTVYQIVSAPRRDPLDMRKLGLTLSLLAGVIAAASFIPLPWSLGASVYIEPLNVQHVYTITQGRLAETFVQPGDRVEAGQVLVRLTNIEKQRELEKLKTQLKSTEIEIEVQRRLSNPGLERLAEERRDTLLDQIEDTEQQIAKLTITAPCAGLVIAPERQLEPKFDRDRRKLNTWRGSPLDPKNRDAWLPPMTHLLSVAPSDQFQAVMLVAQSDRNEITTGMPVRLKLDHLPDRVYVSRVDSISSRVVDTAPTPLTKRAGGELHTVPDERGRELLAQSMYQAIVHLDEDKELMRTGFRGTARFVVARHTAAGWVARWISNTFNFRI
jgi:putative peptide zinc metalloprotease protein